MSAAVLNLPRGATGTRAPLLPAHVDVHTADGCHFDLPDLRDSDWVRTLDLAHRGAVAVLHMESMRGKPSGSLPNDDGLLASYLGFSIREVDQFLAMKAKVLHGWILCSDGRLYHPLRAKSILQLWIGWRETNRRSALGNGARNVEVRRGIREIEADIEEAAEALRELDPKNKFLDDLEARMSKWTTRQPLKEVPSGVTASVTPGEPTVTEAVPPLQPPLNGSHKLSEAKLSEAESSSPRRGDDSSDLPNDLIREIEPEEGSAKRTIRPGQIQPWPPGWFELFKARYPKRDTGQAWGRAEKVLDRIRRSGKVPFEEILDGIDWMLGRLASGHIKPQYTPLASTWLNDRGWEDRLAPKTGHSTPPADSPPSPRVGAEPSITQRAAMLAAERLGLLDEPRPRG